MTKGDGKPCVRCGTSEWYKSGGCKRCQNINSKRWREENPERNIELVKQWNENNKERKLKNQRDWYSRNSAKAIAYARKWQINNPEKVRQMYNEWAENNPHKISVKNNNRRVSRDGFGSNYTAAEFKQLCNQYNNRCLCCGKKKKLTADHVVPVSKGGPSDISNIQPLCKSCNSKKRDRVIDYRTKPGIKRWIQERLLG